MKVILDAKCPAQPNSAVTVKFIVCKYKKVTILLFIVFIVYQAVQCQHENCVRILLENHANPNLVDIDDNTALHLAANVPSISTAVLLLEHDADIGAQNKVIFFFSSCQTNL